jgi:hypothetical protein
MQSFSAKIQIIGVNPYVLLPAAVLKALFIQAGKEKGPIPVKGTLNGHPYTQTLVKFSGKWRLYLNTPMRKATGLETGDKALFEIAFDPADRTLTMHPGLAHALKKNKKANSAFETLAPYRKKEIIRYIGFLKTEESLVRNIEKVINHLLGKERFAGRD